MTQTELVEREPTFDLDFVKATVESLVHYCEATGVNQLNFTVCNWKIVMKEKVSLARGCSGINKLTREGHPLGGDSF